MSANSTPVVFAVFDDGSGQALYAGGNFSIIGGTPANGIARWNGSEWEDLGGVTGGEERVAAIAVFDDGTGPAIFIGGRFTAAGGQPAASLAKWDGRTWTGIEPSLVGRFSTPAVGSLAVFDDGTGPALYVSGAFIAAGGLSVNNIAKWDGASWSALGSGIDQSARALTVYDDGKGAQLYVGGGFESAGGVSRTRRVARWNGFNWASLGQGIEPGIENGPIHTLTVHDDGFGPGLYVGGCFEQAGGVPGTQALALWRNDRWSSVNANLGEMDCVTASAVFDDGRGPALYAAGNFTQIGGLPVSRIARWDGDQWSDLDGGPDRAWVLEIFSFEDDDGPTLWVSGIFGDIGDQEYLARYQYVCSCPADCNNDGTLTVQDVLCFLNIYANADPEADFNNDGHLDIRDLLAFLNAYNTGC